MKNLLLLLFAVASVSPAGADPFSTIDYWVGEGANRAALVIDWGEAPDAGPALAWGYRWDGAATGRDLIRAVVTDDPRLFAKFNQEPSSASLLYGLGYDADADNDFGVEFTPFDAAGFANGAAEDGAAATDPSDLYAEGFGDLVYWHYTTRAAGGPWVSSNDGFANRRLSSGDWDGWVATAALRPDGERRTIEELIATRVGDPTPAPAPHLPGDFNADGAIDAADYTVWRDTSGGAVAVAGAGADADFSWSIDGADLLAWRAAYGAGPFAGTIPEPAASWLLSTVFLANCFFTLRRAP